MSDDVTKAAALLGRRGGLANTEAQQAQRAQPKPGAGRPRSRGAKMGVAARQKAVCEFCGKGIWNRMVYRGDAPSSSPGYAHSSCARKHEPDTRWEKGW